MDIKLIIEIITWLAVILTLLGYYLISSKVIDAFSYKFQLSVLIARLCFLGVNIWRGTYPFALMDLFFLMICINNLFKLKNNKINN